MIRLTWGPCYRTNFSVLRSYECSTNGQITVLRRNYHIQNISIFKALFLRSKVCNRKWQYLRSTAIWPWIKFYNTGTCFRLQTVYWGLCYKTDYGRNEQSYDRKICFCVIKHWITVTTVIWPYHGKLSFLRSPYYYELKDYRETS